MIILTGPIAYSHGFLSVKVHPTAEGVVKRFLERLGGHYAIVKVDQIRKARSTGPGSQNRHINGHIQQIAQETGNDFYTVKVYCKTQALSRGYPVDVIKGQIVPWSEARIDTKQAAMLIDTIHQVASELGIILQEE